MLEFIKKNLKVILVLLSIPIIFIGILEYFSEEITVDGWLGFLGGYFGILGAVGAIWYQKSLDNEAAIKSMELYTNYIVESLFHKLENDYIFLITTFATLDGYNEFYEIGEITKRKKEFNIINTDIINSNLSIILSNQKFIILLSLKEKLDDLNYYVMKLEENITKGDIYYPLMDSIDEILRNNDLVSESLAEIVQEFRDLSFILLKLNIGYFTKSIKFDEEITSKYKYLVSNIIKAFDNKNKTNLNLLKCYEHCIGNIARIISLINEKFQLKTSEYCYYMYNLLNLINVMIGIYKDIEKLKSTNQ